MTPPPGMNVTRLPDLRCAAALRRNADGAGRGRLCFAGNRASIASRVWAAGFSGATVPGFPALLTSASKRVKAGYA